MATEMDSALPEASTSTLVLREPPALVVSAAPSTRAAGKQRCNFFRDAKVSPDGSCALVLAEDRSLSLYIIPSSSSSEQDWLPEWTYHPPDAVLSYEWFPRASPANPPYFAFAVGVKDHPVQLLDGSDHRIRASYPIIDHRERFVAPHSMAFAPDGSKLYCGFENAIEILDIAQPGSEGIRLHTSPTRSSRSGQKGIMSSLAFSPDYSGILAAGSFNGTIGLYDTTCKNVLVRLLRSEATGGITKLAFHPSAHLLYSASRLSDHIEVWDVRNLSQPRGRYSRAAKTNQRLGFDLDGSGTWLVAGDENGVVSFFSAEFDPANAEPVATFSADEDPVGGALFIPSSTKLLTCSGTRHYESKATDDSDSDAEEGSEAVSSADPSVDRPSLKLWQLS
ncbi:WD40-repeat-containing domain protein [Leucosporidium creatinivorum]|uniref:WD40-repeat-containing domain protein n=1 Tax=Leucosporidium creatinivorum TaxID=106004 RepID=A0A1Y2ETX4_9BASI|nr:WD40-repeat-containing domain protein [Leucosporidium creatinivorum]